MPIHRIHRIHRASRILPALALLLSGMLRITVDAQIPGGQTGFNPALLQLFGNHKAFTTKVELRMTDAAGKDVVKTPMGMALLDRRVRVEVNINQITSSTLDAEGLNMFKRAGMDQVVSILRPDDSRTMVIFPTAKVYAEEPMTESDASGFSEAHKVEASDIGKESFDGHPCVKRRVTVTSSSGKKVQGTIWNATDLKDFPVKIQLPEGSSMVEMTFKDVKLQRPDVSLFQPTAGFTRYESMEKLIQDRVFKAFAK
ncbi:MAG: hypothetical protein HY299_07885 [Verrucomicrobia bacterium]|nr:hypothetical protein [Verrucomicrobiota bacterium]